MFFATDIANFLACQHIATLNREEAEGKITKKFFADPGNDLLKRLGLEHEQKYLRELIDVRGLKVVEIPTDVRWSEAAGATVAAMQQGADAIYQATFLDRTRTGSLAPAGARDGRDVRGPSEEVESAEGRDEGREDAAKGRSRQMTLLDGLPREALAPPGARGGRDARGPSEEQALFMDDSTTGRLAAREPGLWGGRADFLIRVESPSKLGPWSYEVVETKLAKSTKAGALIQLCFYSDLVAEIQGLEPRRMHVVLGGGAAAEEFQVQRYLAYFRKVRRDFQAALASKPVTYPEPVEHCRVCGWFPNCDERRHTDDHLSLVASITSNQRKALVEREITKLAQLAILSPPGIRGQKSEVRGQSSEVGDQSSQVGSQKSEIRIAAAPLWRIREQARVQMRGRTEKRPVHELLEPVQSGCGLAALPLPSPGDVFLDFEGDPFAFEQGLEYLFGVVTLNEGNDTETRRDGDTENFGDDRSPESQEASCESQRQADAYRTSTQAYRTSEAYRTSAPEVRYEGAWAFNPAEEKRAFQSFINRIKERRRQYPGMHIYHYAPYETTAIKHLAGRHGICTNDVDELLRGEVFVDLFRVVRQAMRCSVESYSIKRLEPFYEFKRTVALRDATSSLQAFETVLALGDSPADSQEILKTIEDYNRDDCVSAWRLREWLEALRLELEKSSDIFIPRPELKSGAPGEDLATHLSEVALVMERLVAGLPEEESEWTNEQRGRWLLAQMLEWHRREDKSAWWEYYRLCDLSEDELLEDKSALGGLIYLGEVDHPKKSIVHRYRFPPQDHAIDRARKVDDPRTKKRAGEKGLLDELNCTIDLKRGKNSEVPHPTALIPYNYVETEVLIESLLRIGKWVADNGIEGPGSFQAARDALLRSAPRLTGGNIASIAEALSPVEAAKKLVLALDSSIFPIQGPPGSGKTYTGAQMIIELVQAGKRVGITAASHKVISNLLNEVCKAVKKGSLNLPMVQKSNEFDGCAEDLVTQVEDNAEVLEKLQSGEAQLAAGTPWLWAREEMADSVDVLFVDEAGQMSLANVLAVSPSAKSVVLLGDPQQLDQPQQGVHPPRAEASALAHLLNGRATIGIDQGLFLSETWRLHPDICAFTSELFYDGRLVSRPENRKLRLNCRGVNSSMGSVANGGRPRSAAPTAVPSLDGTGLRYVPVIHSGNQSDSPEEVGAIVEIVGELLRGQTTWTDKEGETKPLELKDILIVAPYNAQVLALKAALPDAKVGTVDKFQGQEAPVVFYSMTTSTPEGAPRGMEFLYSLNRLNVATSRAQCVTVLVASPALFEVQCKTPRQIELANAFCRYLEMARLI